MSTDDGEWQSRKYEREKSLSRLLENNRTYRNLTPSQLCDEAIARGEGRLTHQGVFTAVTTPHCGRSPNDRFTVRESSTADHIDWGSVNVPFEEENFFSLREEILQYLDGRDLFVQDARAGAHPDLGINVRVVTHNAWHCWFAHNMFLRLSQNQLETFNPNFTVLHAPGFEADPEKHGTNSGTFIVVNLKEGEVLIGGSNYAGEIKKSIFSALNYMLPDQDVLPMHCSANLGRNGDSALFFGLSGTGKTTLSADPLRNLIGDDEHGWGADGIFNFEGGCYAKTIRLTPESEPEIYKTTEMVGTILENVVLNENSSEPDFDDGTISENARASYPIEYIPNAVVSGMAGHPENIVFLTADAFGVLPPISILTSEQAMYHFLSGYTAKVAGTERGINEPRATFSACFGAPFLPRSPSEYARMLGRLLEEHGTQAWLVNTGWSGGGYGVGERIKLSYTRAMVRAAVGGDLSEVAVQEDPVFGLSMPVTVAGVPSEVLNPPDSWKHASDYHNAASDLAQMFKDNFDRLGPEIPSKIKQAGPK
ncbi:MAG: phosphoenolpyruvate carboxykinase (ATP) [Gemmatimonadetes bacterium]|jgi:phosphoenolpyruvate carboxykinase (ATP)|nr:phosphoenolpyruvate carboxykinase (ATP) [Gemmatimonadota bacterium]